VRRCGFDETQMTVAGLGAMRKRIGQEAAGMFVAVGALVAKLREVKDSDEIAAMRRAALLGCELFEEMLGYMRSGLTEVAWRRNWSMPRGCVERRR